MGTRYTTNTISGYDPTPSGLSDDGSEVAGNRIDFADVYSNLTDPVKSLAEAVNTDLVNHFDVASDATKTGIYLVDSDDDRRMVPCDGTFTVSMDDCAILGNGFEFAIKNVGTGVITLNPYLSQTVDGASNMTLPSQYTWAVLRSDGANWNVVGSNIGAALDIAGTTAETDVDRGADSVLGYDSSASANREMAIDDIMAASIKLDTAKATTSGSTKDWDIPSWARLIRVIFDGNTMNLTDDILVQLGTSSSFETTGYDGVSMQVLAGSAAAASSSTSGFPIRSGNAAYEWTGHMVITKIESNTYVASHTVKDSTNRMSWGAGSKTLSGALTRIRVTTSAGASFNGGNLNVMYE